MFRRLAPCSRGVFLQEWPIKGGDNGDDWPNDNDDGEAKGCVPDTAKPDLISVLSW